MQGKPLPKKLGIKAGHRVCLLGAPRTIVRRLTCDEVRIAEAATGESAMTGEHGSNEKLGTTAGDGCGSETAQGEDVAKGQPAGAKVPAKPKPIRYLDGKQVSEYEWERNEQIERNKKDRKSVV